MRYIGFDIGGTKCAVSVTEVADGKPVILERAAFPTPASQQAALDTMTETARDFMKQYEIAGVGISAGNPMDAPRGVFLNPPNLPGWSGISWTEHVTQTLGIPARMENDANACALAEWYWGAGKGCRNMIFLTFGTGFGAGLILDGKLYRGACGNAGEVGHWRMADFGPSGYGKSGAYEGFCSGGGLAQLGESVLRNRRQTGTPCGLDENDLSARAICTAAAAGDPDALEVIRVSADKLGTGLALMIDLLNPERIVIGSIYARQEALFREEMLRVLRREALADSLAACEIVPATLGDAVGDYATLAIIYGEH